MTWLEIILLLVCAALAICLALSISTGMRGMERATREHIIALTYIRDQAVFYTLDDFARAFLAGGWQAAAKEFPEFAKFRADWIAAASEDDGA
jgi:hypothetical protein